MKAQRPSARSRGISIPRSASLCRNTKMIWSALTRKCKRLAETASRNIRQNIPTARTDKFGIRGAFVAPKKGQVTASGKIAAEDYLISCNDFTGFELYTGIYHSRKFSSNSEFFKMASKGANIHAVTALRMGILPKMVESEAQKLFIDEEWNKLKKLVKGLEGERIYTNAKNSNFGLFYGGSWKMFCGKLGIDYRDPKNEAYSKSLIKAWNAAWPEVRIYQKGIIQEGYDQGYIQTISGRRIHVADGLYFEHPDEQVQMKVRSHWERKCCNVPQATSADIVKEAMNAIERDPYFAENNAMLLLQVHDEILNETPTSKAQETLERVQYHMKAAFREELGFEIPVEGNSAENWKLAK